MSKPESFKNVLRDIDIDNVFTDVRNEVKRQVKLWGEQSHFNHVWYSILGEEYGEVAKLINENEPNLDSEINKELIQCAAVVVSWLVDKERRDK